MVFKIEEIILNAIELKYSSYYKISIIALLLRNLVRMEQWEKDHWVKSVCEEAGDMEWRVVTGLFQKRTYDSL